MRRCEVVKQGRVSRGRVNGGRASRNKVARFTGRYRGCVAIGCAGVMGDQDGAHAIEAECQTTVGRSAVIKGAEQETELLLSRLSEGTDFRKRSGEARLLGSRE
jgi:hypothetical protein